MQDESLLGLYEIVLHDTLMALQTAEVALVQCANIIRPSYPSFANHIIPAHLATVHTAIANALSARTDLIRHLREGETISATGYAK